MKKVIFFPNQSTDEILQSQSSELFLTLIANDINTHDLETISPNFMKWNHNTWILDLSFSTHYWSNESKKENVTIHQLITLLCEKISPSGYSAALAPDPWIALLLAKMLKKKQIESIVLSSSQHGKNLIKHIEWDIWFDACFELIEVELLSKQTKQSKAERHRRDLNLLKSYIEHLNIETPNQFLTFAENQIQRRFGSWISSLCIDLGQISNTQFMRRRLEDHPFFPWCRYQLEEIEEVNRYLEYPLNNWEFIEEYLREDLNKLSFLETFKEDNRIINMEWQVVLHDLEEVSLKIQFRHPYNLHKEAPHYRTALLQILYYFENWKIRYQKEKSDQRFFTEPSIISWDIRIKTKLIQPKTDQFLFESNTDLQSLINLENRLLTDLKSYISYDSWIPENSYKMKKEYEDQKSSSYSNKAAYLKRPLYLYTQPKKLGNFDHCTQWLFCERTMGPWWEENMSQNQIFRDYYKIITSDKHLWSYCNDQGEWLVHGIFS